MTGAEIPAMPEATERVSALLAQMTLEEKAAQLVGYWLDQGGEVVAPLADEMSTAGDGRTLADITKDGIGHYTRVYGTRPVEPADRAAWLWDEQRRLKRETRLGIPALVHEECLTGLAAWKAATFPTPLAWGAAFDPELVAEMGALIGESMRELGIHQGLAPVLDVIRDPRWGRVDECIGEDPYLVGTVGTAYVQGLQSTGVHATLKHFLGYSASRAGRNHAPVSAGAREVADVFLPPFEMAIRDGGVKSVMNSYAEIDGIPVASNADLLTGLLREQLGFDGVVVADYFAVAFLEAMHAVAADRGEAAALALTAGIDVELPTGDAYLAPLVERVRSGKLDEAYVDRAVIRVLLQKEELGLLDPDAFESDAPAVVDLDTPRHREVARKLAEQSLVLLSNDGALPLAASAKRIAVIGPNADRAEALQGCYSFANHVLAHHPEYEIGFEIPTVRDALVEALPDAEIVMARGCEVEGEDRSGFEEAEAAASAADVAIVVVGDQAGLFGRGTVGEGNDVESLELPDAQRELVDRLVSTGTPVVMVMLTGRPYAVGWALDEPTRPAAVLQSFFPGEEGGRAIAVRAAAGEPAPVGGCATLQLPASGPRRSVRRHLHRPDARAPVRIRAVLHLVRVQRPHRRRERGHGRALHRVGHGHQHRGQRRYGRRSALRPRPGRDGHSSGGAAARLCADAAGRGRVAPGHLRRSGFPPGPHGSSGCQGRRAGGRRGVGGLACGGSAGVVTGGCRDGWSDLERQCPRAPGDPGDVDAQRHRLARRRHPLRHGLG
jgi:beta-glucosidase